SSIASVRSAPQGIFSATAATAPATAPRSAVVSGPAGARLRDAPRFFLAFTALAFAAAFFFRTDFTFTDFTGAFALGRAEPLALDFLTAARFATSDSLRFQDSARWNVVQHARAPPSRAAVRSHGRRVARASDRS